MLWGCPLVVRFPAVAVLWPAGLRWVAGLGGGLRFAPGGRLSCVLFRCCVMALVAGLWCGVVALVGAWWRVVVSWLSVVWVPVAGGRPQYVRWRHGCRGCDLWASGMFLSAPCVGVRPDGRESAVGAVSVACTAVAGCRRWGGVGDAGDVEGRCWGVRSCSSSLWRAGGGVDGAWFHYCRV